MRTTRPLFLLLVCLVVSASVPAQESGLTPTTDPQAVALLQNSLATLTGGTSVTDVRMSGTVTMTAVTTSQSGTVTMVATAAGQSQVTFVFSGGSWTTTANYSANPRTSTTSSSTGVTNDPPEDLLGPHPAWFYPAFLIGAALQPSYVPSKFEQETQNGTPIQHVSIVPQSPMPLFRSISAGWMPLTGPTPEPNLYFGQQDLYIALSSAYPSALVFRVQAQPSQTSSGSNRSVFLPEEVRYMNYQIVQGRPVATHLQVYIGSVLTYDIQISSITFNTGVAIAAN
jgi:hypothetical protein